MAAVPSVGRASLLERPAAREAEATHALYESHSRRIYSYCLHQLGSREEAEDAMQITFMNAFRALSKGVVPQTETAWLFKIAENVCLSRRRSTWRRGRIESPSDFQLIEEVVAGPTRQRDELIGIEDALAAMPEQQRRAILLREWQGLSYKEIAEELELSQAAVETLIFRARRTLAAGLTEPEKGAAKKSRLRRALNSFDLSALLGAAKAVLGGSAAVKATVAAVAVTAAATGAAVTVVPAVQHHPAKQKPVAVSHTWSSSAPTSSNFAAAAAATAPFASGVPASVVDWPPAAASGLVPTLGPAGHPSGGGSPAAPESSDPSGPSSGVPATLPAAPVEEPTAATPAPAPAPSEPAAQPPAPKPEEPKQAAATPPPTVAAPVAPPKDDGKSKADPPVAATPAAPAPAAPAPKNDGKSRANPPVAAAPTLPAAAPKGKDDWKAKEDGKSKADPPAAAPTLVAPAAALPPAGAPKAPARTELVAATQSADTAKVKGPDQGDTKSKDKDDKPPKGVGPLYSPPSTPPPATAGQSSAPIVTPPPADAPPAPPAPLTSAADPPAPQPPAQPVDRKDSGDRKGDRQNGDKGEGDRGKSKGKGR